MSKENLIGNSSAVVGTTAGAWAFLTDNATAISSVFVIATFAVYLVSTIHSMRNKNKTALIEKQKLEIDKQNSQRDHEFRMKQLELAKSISDIEDIN